MFIVEEDVRPLDLAANVENLVIKDISNICDMNLQHPELIPLLLSVEPMLKENEWLQVKGLMSRSQAKNDDACICIVQKTSPLQQDWIPVAQEACWAILDECFKPSPADQASSIGRNKSSGLPSMLASKSSPALSEEEDDQEVSEEPSKPKRMCFEDRLKMALARGDTPDESSKGPSDQDQHHDPTGLVPGRDLIDDAEEDMPEPSDLEEDPSSFSEDSLNSFESLEIPYDLDADFEELQANLIKPLHQDEQCKLRQVAITDELKRMCLSEAYLDICLNLSVMSSKLDKSSRHTKSALVKPFVHKLKDSIKSIIEESKLPIWIINHSSEVDSKRFLVEWLAASVHGIPLVVYQASNGSMSTDVIAAICSWIEEQSWTTEELHNALLQDSNSLM